MVTENVKSGRYVLLKEEGFSIWNIYGPLLDNLHSRYE